MGSAVAWPLSDNGHHVSLVGTHLDRDIIRTIQEKGLHPRLANPVPANVQALQLEELPRALEGVDLIVSGVSSWGVDWIGDTLSEALDRGHNVIGITKGMHSSSTGHVEIFPRRIASFLSPSIRTASSFMAIGGPCIAAELAARRPSCVVFGADDVELAEQTAQLFRTPYYHVWASSDLWSLEVSVALKNGYVLGVGIATGMLDLLEDDSIEDWMKRPKSYNAAAATYAQGLYEMEQLLAALGGNPAYAHSLPGAGDQYVTAMGGRSVTLGTLLGRGYTYSEAREKMAGETLESAAIISAMVPVYERLQREKLLRDDRLPLLEALIDAIEHEKRAELPFDHYFAEITRRR